MSSIYTHIHLVTIKMRRVFESLGGQIDSNMVLQRAPAQAVIWGHHAQPSELVTATLDHGASWNAVAGEDGSWSIRLDPQPASINRTLTLQHSKLGRRRVLRNVAFGDVFLCSGQSNSDGE